MEPRVVVPCALALLALCAVASARPQDADNHIVDSAANVSNIGKDDQVHLEEQDGNKIEKTGEGTKIEKTGEEHKENEKLEESSEPKESVENATRSANERFPSAVLFGATCGGTIISPTWVLTAAHCSLFWRGMSVLAGTGDSWSGSGVTRRAKRVVIHPLFTVGPYWLDANKYDINQVAARWDFMLVELSSPLPLDGRTMAAAALDDETAPEGTPIGYAGYGAEHHGETMRHHMHAMELSVRADAECAAALPQYNPRDMLCTRGVPPRFDSACNGDSGSGLVSGGVVRGVLSWLQDDSHRCFNGALVVASRVSAARDWIRQVTKI